MKNCFKNNRFGCILSSILLILSSNFAKTQLLALSSTDAEDNNAGCAGNTMGADSSFDANNAGGADMNDDYEGYDSEPSAYDDSSELSGCDTPSDPSDFYSHPSDPCGYEHAFEPSGFSEPFDPSLAYSEPSGPFDPHTDHSEPCGYAQPADPSAPYSEPSGPSSYDDSSDPSDPYTETSDPSAPFSESSEPSGYEDISDPSNPYEDYFNNLKKFNEWVDAGMPVWNDTGNACIPGVVAPAFQTFVLHPFSMHCIMVFLAMLLCIKKGRFDGGDTPFDFCLEREDVRGGNRTSVLPIWEVQMLAPPGVWVGGVSLNITGPALKADHML